MQKLPPLVPTPAPALISPVGCSSTSISMIFKSFADPGIIFELTVLKIFLDLRFAIDFSKLRFVNGSPSSNNSSLLITLSLVILFPLILILSTEIFSPSLMLNVNLIFVPSIVSLTSCSTNWRLFSSIILSISSKIFLILIGE